MLPDPLPFRLHPTGRDTIVADRGEGKRMTGPHLRRCAAAFLAILSGCQQVRPGPDICPPLPTQLELVRDQGASQTLITAQFNRFDRGVIGFARLYLRRVSSPDTTSQELASDSTGHVFASAFNPGRYVVVPRALGFGSRRDTVEVGEGQSVRLTYTLTPEPTDRCGFEVIVRPRRGR